MPSPDQFQASLDAQQKLAQAMAQFSQVPQLLQNQQQALVGELASRFFKRKSIFRNLTGQDANFVYPVNQQGSPYAATFFSASGSGNINAAVFPIENASELVIRLLPPCSPNINNGFPTFLMFALSPSDQLVQIDPNQFSLVKTQIDMAIDPNSEYSGSNQAIFETIPCEGNRYLHLLGGYLGEGDWASAFIPSIGGTPAFNFSISLIK